MRRLIAVAVTAVLIGLLGASAARAGSSDEARFVALTNASRSEAGLAGYAVAGDLADVARGQAERMAAEHRIFHNANLASDVTDWEMAGENVGVGATADGLHQALMRSPDHRSNILSPDFTEIGVGVVVGDDGRMYVSEVFRLPAGSAPAAPEPAFVPSEEPEPELTPVPAPVVDAAPVAVPEAVAPVEVAAPVAVPHAPSTSVDRRADLVTVASVHLPDGAPRDWRAAWVATVLAFGVLSLHVSVWRRGLVSGRS